MTNDSYYGRMDEVTSEFRKEKGVQLYMVDHHITKIVDKHIERFQKEIASLIEKFKNDDLMQVKNISKGMTTLTKDISMLQKQIMQMKALIKKEDKEKANG
jgi:hypothetical protein